MGPGNTCDVGVSPARIAAACAFSSVTAACRVVQRLQRDHHLDRRAVRVRDDPARPVNRVLEVHLGDDERALGVHAPRAGVVDDDGPRCGCDGPKLARDRRAGAEERELDPREASRLKRLDGDLFPAEPELRTGALRARERDETPHGEPTLLENSKHLAPYGARRADHGNRYRHASLLAVRLIARDKLTAQDTPAQMSNGGVIARARRLDPELLR
jgi:hypothetical protein